MDLVGECGFSDDVPSSLPLPVANAWFSDDVPSSLLHCRKLCQHHVESGFDGLGADGGAVACEEHSADDLPAMSSEADEDGADGLFGSTAAWSCDAADGDAQVGATVF